MNIYLKNAVSAVTLVLLGAVASGGSAVAHEWTDGGDDVPIADAVRAALVSHGVPGARRVRFQVLDHVVYLHGESGTSRAPEEEMDIIRGVQGVTQVVDMTSSGFNG